MATSAMGRAVLGGLVTQSPEVGRSNKYLHLASVLPSSLFFFFPKYLFIWVCQFLVVACRIFSCRTRDL